MIQENLIKGALLHDIGKVLIRKDRTLGNHSTAGADFLKANSCDEMIWKAAQYHHSDELRTATLPKDDVSYIIYEADNIAAAADRRSIEDTSGRSFDSEMPLKSIFTTFGGSSSGNQRFYLRELNAASDFNYPTDNNVKALSNKYREIVSVLKNRVSLRSLEHMSVNEVLCLMEDIGSFVPSSTNIEEVSDISLFMHSKVTAAIATAMKEYLVDRQETDYKKYCFTNASKNRTEDMFLMISGDFSGIQDFIYTIPSKGALKSLRGRSIYLEVFLEVVLDELLEQLNLSRANIIYVGGGHFYVLAPNTKQVEAKTTAFFNACNTWLLDHFGTKLYLAFGMEPCSALDLMGQTEKNIFLAVNRKMSREKSSRYSATTLKALFDEESTYNKLQDGTRECGVCHTSTRHLSPYGDSEDTLACDNCSSLFRFGADVLKENTHFIVVEQREELKGIPVFGAKSRLELLCIPESQLANVKQWPNIKYLYGKNKVVGGDLLTARLWIGDYVSRTESSQVKEFATLSKESVSPNQGIDRLGVLRADVDNLGAAFLSGFVGNGETNLRKYDTLTRKADLSKDMSKFFKLAVQKICEGNLEGLTNTEPFTIFAKKGEHKRNIHIIYAGGDDMFLVGSWDELLEVAVDIRRAFQQFTGDKLSFSAGLALFNPAYPITAMAESTGLLESIAKDQPHKNSIALFGLDTEQQDENYEISCRHVYDWNRFVDAVCGEKLQFIKDTFNLEGNANPQKLEAGKGLLYRLMELLESIGTDQIYLARFVYTLARMEPKEKFKKAAYDKFTSTTYAWVKNKKDREELLTALHLLVYYLREKGER